MNRSTRERFTSIGLVCGGAVACIAIGRYAMIPIIAHMWLMTTFPGEVYKFLDRHREADLFIAETYRCYLNTGKWPANSRILTSTGISLSEDWHYEPASRLKQDEAVTPYLLLRGPYRTRLRYTFRESGDNEMPGGWEAKMEGTPIKYPFVEKLPFKG